MDTFIAFLIPGLFTGAAYAIAASGLVLTYTTTRVFNIAHGAFGMVLSFVFWDLTIRQGLNVVLSLFLVLFVIAPLIGFIMQRLITRGLGNAPVGVSLVVTVGMFVGLIGFAQQYWPEDRIEPEAPRFVPPFWLTFADGDGVPGWQVAGTSITGLQLITILSSIVVAVGLYLLLNKTRIGTAMRASVDNPELLRLFGGKPDNAAALAWMIGMSLAALTGILLVSVVGLDYFGLTLLVVNAYAAAMVGRLKSLPMTFAGAMGIGVFESLAIGYSTDSPLLSTVRPAIVPIFLFAVIVLAPQAQLRIGQVKGMVSAPVPSIPRMGIAGAATLLVAALFVTTASDVRLLQLGTAATYAIVMLSLVLLTGYGGHVSLAQLSFAGVGALTYAKLDEPNLSGLVMATLVAAGVGALVALPVLRLTGLYLALATLAFAVIMEKVVFKSPDLGFGSGGAVEVERLSILGYRFESTGAYVFLMVAFMVAIGMGVLVVRRGVVGRMLIAMRDSPAACGTLGLDMRWFRVGLFASSAGIAGLAGALVAGLRRLTGEADFIFFNSLPLLLLAVVFGITSVTGAVLGGVGLMLLPVLQAETVNVLGSDVKLGGLMFMVIGIGAVLAARDPNGLSNYLFRFGRFLERRLRARIVAGLPQLTTPDGLAADGLTDGRTDGGADETAVHEPAPTGVPLGKVVSDGAPARG
ncbi:ABC transporter permease [Nocardioides sp.]|uniref:branched-chain amino acid ABC transporter permease n=1 Tax=Nocardioides sp. TaxID=35761 RepID=UPI00271BBC9A|nr:ABC transporter permease [Nocardioides sp.]MDO9455129.1 ABC transporter permease [Nocardioides sp.]